MIFFDLAKMWSLTDSYEYNDVNETAAATPDKTLVESLVSGEDIAPNNTSIGKRGIPGIGIPTTINLDTVGLRRSPKMLAQDGRPKRVNFFTILYLVINVVVTSASVIKNTSSYVTRAIAYMEEINRNFNVFPNFTYPFALATSLANNESYTLNEALKQEDAADFIQVMLKELDAYGKENFQLTDEWNIERYLGVKVKK